MNFLAMPTLKNVRSCLRLPISMMPRFSLKLTLARLRTGIASVGSLLFSAAVITASATLMSFFSTAPVLLRLRLRHGSPIASALRGLRRLALRGPGLALSRRHLRARDGLRPAAAVALLRRRRPALPLPRGPVASPRACSAALGSAAAASIASPGSVRRLALRALGGDDDRVGQALRARCRGPGSRRCGCRRSASAAIFWSWALSFSFGSLPPFSRAQASTTSSM